MKILIIGGTRFIGYAAAWRLAESGHSVTIFNRGRTEAELPPGIGRLAGDRRDSALDVTPLRVLQPDAVVDMCCITARDARWLADTFSGCTGRLVLISSIDVYRAYGRLTGTEPGELEPVPLTEDSPLRGKWYPYRGETPRDAGNPQRILDDYDKIPAESTVLRKCDTPGTVLRLPMVYGERDYQRRLRPLVTGMTRDAAEYTLPRYQAQWRTCRGYAGDIAAAIELAATHPGAAGRTYNIAEEQNCSEEEWARRVAAALGWTGRICIDTSEPEDGDNTNWQQHLSTDSSRIRAELGYAETLPLEERIRLTADWELAHPPEQQGQTGAVPGIKPGAQCHGPG